MSGFVVLIIIVGAALGALTFFIVRSFVAPRRIEALAESLKGGRYAQVVRQAKQLLARDSRNVDAHYLLGQAYLAEEKPELALMEYKIVNQIGQFTDLCPEVPFRRQAARLYRRYNQHEEALKEYLVLIKQDPVAAENYFQAGELFEERQMTDKAQQFFLKTIQIDKAHTAAHVKLGIIYTRQKKPLEARAELEVGLKLEPDNPRANFYLGRLLKELHDYGGALRALEKAQRDSEFKVKSLIEAGTCYMSMNNLDRAMAVLERAVKLSEDQDSTEGLYGRYFLSLCCEKTRQLDRALHHWEHIYACKPAFRDVAQKLSQYQELRSDDRMKEFMTSGLPQFAGICEAVVRTMKLEVRDTTEVKDGCEILAVEAEKNWRSARRMPRLVLLLRVTEPVDEGTVRSLHERMKKNNVSRGVIATSSGFTRRAREFAETRPVDLVDREALSAYLKQAAF